MSEPSIKNMVQRALVWALCYFSISLLSLLVRKTSILPGAHTPLRTLSLFIILLKLVIKVLQRTDLSGDVEGGRIDWSHRHCLEIATWVHQPAGSVHSILKEKRVECSHEGTLVSGKLRMVRLFITLLLPRDSTHRVTSPVQDWGHFFFFYNGVTQINTPIQRSRVFNIAESFQQSLIQGRQTCTPTSSSLISVFVANNLAGSFGAAAHTGF